MGLGAGLLLAVPVGQSSGDAIGPIRITNREVAYQRVDVGKRGTSPGDMEIIKQSLFNRRVTTKPIGHADLVCTFVDKQARSCRGDVLPAARQARRRRLAPSTGSSTSSRSSAARASTTTPMER